jgi:hypothetical protein
MVVMGETKDVIPEITKIAETKPNILDAKGILIATFSSVAEPRELTDYFKLNGRNFLLFDLSSDNSGYHISKEEISEGLFGFLKQMNEENLKQKTDSLIQEISSTTISNKYKKILKDKKDKSRQTVENKISLAEIETMSANDKNELMNKLIDKGVQNLSEHDKLLLSKLSF